MVTERLKIKQSLPSILVRLTLSHLHARCLLGYIHRHIPQECVVANRIDRVHVPSPYLRIAPIQPTRLIMHHCQFLHALNHPQTVLAHTDFLFSHPQKQLMSQR